MRITTQQLFHIIMTLAVTRQEDFARRNMTIRQEDCNLSRQITRDLMHGHLLADIIQLDVTHAFFFFHLTDGLIPLLVRSHASQEISLEFVKGNDRTESS